MSNQDTPRIGRRVWLGRGLLALAAVPVLGACGESELTCPSPAAEHARTRTGLNYVDRTTNPDRACRVCILYTGDESACGTCTVVEGPIHPNGTCDGFVARET